MTGAAFVAALVLLPLLGWGLVPRRAAAWLPIPANVAVAAGLGALGIAVEMVAMSAAGISWTVLRIGAVPLVLTVLRIASRGTAVRGWSRPRPLSLIAVVAGLSLPAYASLTTRATSADLLFFWGPKAERFALAAGIDFAYLTDPSHWALHTDYPPLLPCLWAFASLLAGRFAWGASLATLPIFAGFLVLAAWGLARLDQDQSRAATSAALVAALLAATLPVSGTAGNADPVLLCFEGTALLLMLFGGDRPGATSLSGALLAAGVLTKFEGTFFAVALIGATLFSPRRNRVRQAAIMATFPAAALMSWLAFCRARRLLSFLGHPPRLYLDAARLGIVARGLVDSASYGAFYAPWIVSAVLLLLARPARPRLALALGTAAAILAADSLIYLVSPEDPTLWVGWSGARLLLTPLFCLYAAAISAPGGAAARSRPPDDRTRTAASAAVAV